MVPLQPHFLMCAPRHFDVEYVINPWMRGNAGTTRRDTAQAQWNALHHLLTDTLGACVSLVAPQPHVPDLVFTANAGLIRGRLCVPTRFRHAERRGEEPHFRAWFTENGFILRDLPEDIAFEGAGDALFSERDAPTDPPRLWAAHGFRTDLAAHAYLADIFAAEVISLALVDPRFYHLDTCFCPLPGGILLWFPPAFDAASRCLVEERLPREKRIAVCDEDAIRFACNAIGLHAPDGNPTVILNAASTALREALSDKGFTVHETPLTEFLKAGGSAKCLTLQIAP